MKRQNIKDFKLVMLGASGVGKTSLVQRFTKDVFDSAHSATCGLAYLTHIITAGDVSIKLNSKNTFMLPFLEILNEANVCYLRTSLIQNIRENG